MATATVVSQGSGSAWKKSQSQRRLAVFAWAVTGYNVLVILWGALVRATGSGAGCGNHWPLCNGQVIPVSPGIHTKIEFTHRMMVGGALFPMLLLLVWSFRAMPRGAAARWFAGISTALMLNEAVLGALLVKLGYVTDNQSVGRMVLLSIHLSNTLLMLAAMTLTARMVSTGQRWRELWSRRQGAARAERAVRWLPWAGVLATLAVGVSGSLAALGDTLFPSPNLKAAIAEDLSAGAPLLIRLRGMHPLSAVVAAACVLWMLKRSWQGGRAGWPAKLLVGLLAMQFLLGLADVVLLAPAWMQLLHLLGADLFWVNLVVMAASIAWPVHEKVGTATA